MSFMFVCFSEHIKLIENIVCVSHTCHSCQPWSLISETEHLLLGNRQYTKIPKKKKKDSW